MVLLMIEQALNGVQLGIILFLMAAGLTLTFGIMNFVNLAHGSLFMVGAYAGLGAQAATGSFLAGLAAAILAGLLLGLALEMLLIRHLYRRDHVDQVLCTVGIIFVFNEGARWLWGPEPLYAPVPTLLNRTVEVLPGAPYPAYRLAIIAIGLLVAALLSFLINRTRTGMLIRAGASNRTMTTVLGVNINALFGFIFALGAALGALAGYISAPLLTVYPGMGDNILILALVVVVVGGMGSIRGAFVAALTVGVVDTIGRAYLKSALGLVLSPVAANTVAPALASMLIYIVMALVLFLKPEGLMPPAGARRAVSVVAPLRAPRRSPLAGTLARWGVPALVLACLALAVLPFAADLIGKPFWPVLVSRMMVFAIAALSLDLLLGRTGLVSFGHALYLGIGAYVVVILSQAGIGNAVLHVAGAVVVAALVAVPLSAVALRTNGSSYIMITLAFAQMMFFGASSLYDLGGDDGMALPERSHFGGLLDPYDPNQLYYLVLAILAAVVALGIRLNRSRFGTVLRGIRINETRMAALGYPVLAYKLVASLISAAVCGLSGALLANVTEFVGPQFMDWSRSGELIVMVVMGGLGTAVGPVVGAFAYLGLEKGLSDLTVHWRLLLGAVLIAIVFLERGGLMSLFETASGPEAKREVPRWMPFSTLSASPSASAE